MPSAASRLSEAAITKLIASIGKPGLISLELYWNLNVGDGTLLCLAGYAPQLIRLSLSGCKHVSDEGLRTLTGSCTKLTHLDLTR